MFIDAIKLKIPPEIIMSLIEMYAFDIDFQRDIKQGDQFMIVFEMYKDNKDKNKMKFVEYYSNKSNKNEKDYKTGKIIYSSVLLNNKDNLEFFYLKKLNDYFDSKGRSLKKGLMRTPINGARLSSNFGYRRHPVLGYSKLHKGIDFAAPKGTPIFAAGNGTVVFCGNKSTYGNYVKIRHNETYSTAYAHLSKFAKIKTGASVKQGDVIGYVGTTGRSTGNHLHYEIIKNGIQVNPISIRTKPSQTLKDKDLIEFYEDFYNFKSTIAKKDKLLI